MTHHELPPPDDFDLFLKKVLAEAIIPEQPQPKIIIETTSPLDSLTPNQKQAYFCLDRLISPIRFNPNTVTPEYVRNKFEEIHADMKDMWIFRNKDKEYPDFTLADVLEMTDMEIKNKREREEKGYKTVFEPELEPYQTMRSLLFQLIEADKTTVQ